MNITKIYNVLMSARFQKWYATKWLKFCQTEEVGTARGLIRAEKQKATITKDIAKLFKDELVHGLVHHCEVKELSGIDWDELKGCITSDENNDRAYLITLEDITDQMIREIVLDGGMDDQVADLLRIQKWSEKNPDVDYILVNVMS